MELLRKDKRIYREGDKLIKLFDEHYSISSILNEALNQSLVAETGLNIPKIREVSIINGKCAISMDYIEGKTLEELMLEFPEKQEEYLNLFIDVMLEIHSKRCSLLRKFKDKMTMRILECELSASTRYDLSLRLDKMPNHMHVCHGDFNPSNVIITKDGTPYIIDWSHASQGNASADAVKTNLIFLMDNKWELAETFLRMYAERTGTDQKYLKSWIPLVATAQLVKVDAPTKSRLMEIIEKFECYE